MTAMMIAMNKTVTIVSVRTVIVRNGNSASRCENLFIFIDLDPLETITYYQLSMTSKLTSLDYQYQTQKRTVNVVNINFAPVNDNEQNFYSQDTNFSFNLVS